MIKRVGLIIGLMFLHLSIQAQDQPWRTELERFQANLDKEYRTPGESPLKGEALERFPGHIFFPINPKYRVIATLELTPNIVVFNMPTSGSPSPYYEYGKLHFSIEGKPYKLSVYVSMKLKDNPEYADYLFLPFGDLTNGDETYGGGRYIDFRIPQPGQQIILDFNKAYNPYCAYTSGYSCPKVPRENVLPIKVEAGIMAPLNIEKR